MSLTLNQENAKSNPREVPLHNRVIGKKQKAGGQSVDEDIGHRELSHTLLWEGEMEASTLENTLTVTQRFWLLG